MLYKFLAGVFVIGFSSLSGFSQKLDPASLDIIRIENLDSLAKVTQLKKTLANARIVLLGEQGHGDGATFDAKVKLIQFLHQELGFNIVAFESGLYSNFKAGQLDRTLKPPTSFYYESVFDIWSDTKQFKTLLEYVKETEFRNNPIGILGFDLQEGSLFKDYFFEDLKETFEANNINLNDSIIQILEETFFGGVDYISTNEVDSMKFYSAIRVIENGFNQLAKDHNSRILYQAFKSYLAGINWAVDIHKNRHHKVQNPRDLQMAKNLIFLSELYPDKKIIGWGASYHFANQIDKYQNTDLTRQYILEMGTENEGFDLDSALYGAKPMGQTLKEKFKDELYSIAFSSHSGTYGVVGNKVNTIALPPKGSIENKINKSGYKYAFIDYSQKNSGSFYSSVLGNLPILAPWQEIFDGLIFINTSYPPEFSEYSEEEIDVSLNTTNYQIIGKVIDAKTGHAVPYAHISLENTSKGTVTNGEGYFEFNLDKIDQNLIISSIGYNSFLLDLNDTKILKDTLEIKLEPEATVLKEIIVSDKSLNVQDILRKAKKSIETNYFQNPYNQEFFYRVQRQDNDSITFTEEASVHVYNKSGYKPSNSAYKSFSGQILQFRNVTDNPGKNKWDGVGSFWLMFSHDLILGKDNILHRTSAYEMELTGVTTYNNEEVYEVSFICKRPSAYTTGYGYPAPKSSHGKLYININDYAILRYEHCIERKNSIPKKGAKYQLKNGKISLIQTYKRYNDKYFLQYSKQVMSGERINTGSMENTRYIQNFDLLSTEIYTDPVVILEKPIDKLKVGMKIKEDKNFWERHNIVLEDHYGKSAICY